MQHTRRLFCAYAAWLNVDVCFQAFEDELANLPGDYAPPRGRLRLAGSKARVVGCVGLRPLDDYICEMKRLWVEPGFRGRGIGRRVAIGITTAGRELGDKTMRLDNLPVRLSTAGHLYQALGFKPIPGYEKNPRDGVVTYELVYDES